MSVESLYTYRRYLTIYFFILFVILREKKKNSMNGNPVPDHNIGRYHSTTCSEEYYNRSQSYHEATFHPPKRWPKWIGKVLTIVWWLIVALFFYFILNIE